MAKKGGKKFKLPPGAVKGGGGRGGTLLTPSAAQNQIQLALERAVRHLNDEYMLDSIGARIPLEASVKTFKYKSGSVDGMLTIKEIPRGVKIRDVLIALENVVVEIPESFISTGLRYSAPEGVESGDYRFRGLTVAHTNYQRANLKRKIRQNFLIARDVNDRLESHRRKKAEQVFVNIHWNPENTRPSRAEISKRKKRNK